MFDDLDIRYWETFCISGETFSICTDWYVTNCCGEMLGHIEECLEQWDMLMKLLDFLDGSGE